MINLGSSAGGISRPSTLLSLAEVKSKFNAVMGAERRQFDKPATAAFLDIRLDNFKPEDIPLMLPRIGRVIRTQIRKEDCVTELRDGRIGVILFNISREDATERARGLLSIISPVFAPSGSYLGISMGMAFGFNPVEFEVLMHKAEIKRLNGVGL